MELNLVDLQAFGVICSPTANCHFDGRLAFVAGWEDVLVWDVKRGEMVRCCPWTSLLTTLTYLGVDVALPVPYLSRHLPRSLSIGR